MCPPLVDAAPFIMASGAEEVLSWGRLRAAWIVHSVSRQPLLGPSGPSAARISGSAVASTLKAVESDLTELSDIPGSAARTPLFIA